jgi:tRNA threonylcarbamoyladenosine biosynthesis protein TsaE
MSVETLFSESEEATIEIGEQFATRLKRGDLVVLKGDLGIGKTEFVKGICRCLSVADLVTSPTFSIINQYAGETPEGETLKVYHVDLYRIESPEELVEVGFDDMVFAHDAIKVVEWPENAGTLLPEEYWQVSLEQDKADDNTREIQIEQVVPDV